MKVKLLSKISNVVLVSECRDPEQHFGQLCLCLGVVIGQRYETADIQRRCELIGVPFKDVESVFQDNGMLTY